MTPEGKIKKLVNVGLKDLQARYGERLWVRMPVTRGMGKPWLDYHLCVGGQTVAIETKKDEKTKLSPQQTHTRRQLEAAGAVVFVVNGPGTALVALTAIKLLLEDPGTFHAYYDPDTREQAQPDVGGTANPRHGGAFP